MSEVPPIFHSFEKDEPFSQCIHCEKSFDDLSVPYTVSKVFKGPECVFEYAMCQSCRAEMSETFSPESRQKIDTFFNNKVNLADRSLAMEDSENHTDWMRSCLTCGTPANEIKDYSMACMAFSGTLVFDPFPMMVCSQCERTIHKQLSKSTRDSWDKFVADHFEGPPADALKPTGVPVLV